MKWEKVNTRTVVSKIRSGQNSANHFIPEPVRMGSVKLHRPTTCIIQQYTPPSTFKLVSTYSSFKPKDWP